MNPGGTTQIFEVKVITHIVSVTLSEVEKTLKITFLHVMTSCSSCIYVLFTCLFTEILGSLKNLESFFLMKKICNM